MFSILLRRVVAVCVTKSEELPLRSRMIIQRTIYTSNVLPVRMGQRKIQELDLDEGLNLSKDPDDFGKVVEFDLENIQKEAVDNKKKTKREQKKKEMKAGVANKKVNDSLDLEEKEEHGEKIDNVEKKKYEDLRRKNTNLFSSLMTQIKSKKGREKLNKIYLEGKRLIHDAIKAGHKPLKVYFSRPSDLDKLELPDGVEAFRVPYKKLQFWSDVVTCQGVIGIFQMPDLSKRKEKRENSIPLTVICDNIREPSNLGSILRVVSSVGCEKVILTPGCVDIWEPKVLRSASGAHFHLPVLKNIPWTEIEEEIKENYKVVLASCHFNADEKENESNPGNIRQTSVFTTDNEASKSLPLKCYSAVDYRNQNTTIVIGGETFGLSPEAIELAKKRKGLRVFIPMSNEVESLNSAVALGILSYMVRYQFELPDSSSHTVQENKTDVN